MKKLVLYLVLFVSFFALPGCGTLDSTGAYQGKKDLYAIDQTIGTEKALADVFVDWEAANRQTIIATRPEVHAFAEKVRTVGRQQITELVKLRDAYAGDPSAANRSALDQALDTLKALLADARTYLVTPIPAKP